MVEAHLKQHQERLKMARVKTREQLETWQDFRSHILTSDVMGSKSSTDLVNRQTMLQQRNYAAMASAKTNFGIFLPIQQNTTHLTPMTRNQLGIPISKTTVVSPVNNETAIRFSHWNLPPIINGRSISGQKSQRRPRRKNQKQKAERQTTMGIISTRKLLAKNETASQNMK